MDKLDTRRTSNHDSDSPLDSRQARQRASVKWLLSKAYNNRVPESVREPFYKDHEDQEHLKPQLVHALANAELYCQALANIYSDPNYHNLNNWGVLQVLARKGIYINDAQLTETVLIQTNPIKLAAHVSVMEALMSLYSKEVATPDRVLAAVNRFNLSSPPPPLPPDHEAALLLWVNEATAALNERIRQEAKDDVLQLRRVSDWSELSNGVCLASLIAFYCPEDLPWRQITINKVPTVSDRVRNLMLVNQFCHHSLPYNVFHMTPEDISFMRGSMRPNLIVFLADLFNVLEIHPAKCVRFDKGAAQLTEAYPRNSQGVAHRRCLPQSVSAIPDLRSGLDNGSSFSELESINSMKKGSPIIASPSLKKSHSNHQTETHLETSKSEETFVVHRGRGVPTLSSVIHEAAGKPSHWEESRRTSYAGRRSRRNSLSDDSQLTIENFGGSQENIHMIGRNPDKEPAVHVPVSRKDSGTLRSTLQDNLSTALSNAIKQEVELEQPNPPPRRDYSAPVPVPAAEPEYNNRVLRGSNSDGNNSSAGLQSVLLDPPSTTNHHNGGGNSGSNSGSNSGGGNPGKKTTFAALPQTTTTWQQQHQSNVQQADNNSDTESTGDQGVMNSQLLNVRLKLEEKRRRIESDKRKMETMMDRQRQKLGKAAFFQAVTKGQGSGKSVKSPESDPGRETNGEMGELGDKPQRPFSLQDISEVEQKWLGESFTEERKTPDIDSMDMEAYQKSIAQMNSSLHEIQSDIQRINQLDGSEPMQSFATLQNNFVNSRGGGGAGSSGVYGGGGGQQQIHSLLYNNPPWHSLVSQPSPPPPQQQQHPAMYGHHNNFVNQQQQMHSLMNQQSAVNHYNTIPQPAMRQYQPQYPDNGMYCGPPPPVPQHQHQIHQHPGHQQQHHQQQHQQHPQHQQQHQQQHPQHQQQQQQQQVNQLLRGVQPEMTGGGGEFYLHGPEKRTWSNTVSQPRNHWNNSHNQPVSLSSSPQTGGFHLHHNGSMEGRGGSASPPPPTPPPRRVTHAPLPAPPVDDMEPQSISFIGSSEEDQLSAGLNRMNITSGTRTYRIPSPTRSHAPLSRNSFSSPTPPAVRATPEKGFYISFDDDTAPKKPKPPLRVKRNSPKKERGVTQVVEPTITQVLKQELKSEMKQTPPSPPPAHSPPPRVPHPHHDDQSQSGVGLVIGTELANPDPTALDEMERKKERILMMSLARRQAQEEMKARKEQEAARRKEAEKLKEEEKTRKKEEEKARRAAILDQYKLKKAIEEAEREGKLIDKDLLNSLKGGSSGNPTPQPPRMRGKTNPRPRPKTIHIDSGADSHDGALTPSRGKKGSSSNLSVFSPPSTMRRDYYRGSQDCLAETRRTSASISDMGDESRGASPGRSLGRRGSYKTSRDSSLDPGRSRNKFSTYQSRRKSNSLMNLSGSSCDQDSLLYRYGDTDSGLGRATPPRRAPSPGQHPPSPSGPGSLPAHRRRYDDAASESGGSEYSGPRLYKQPATKSNKGIILNAVEYCVFPGVVNREAKRLVIEEIQRSEAKHFLILFRDAGCQFRALYSYCPETEEVAKLYGTGPKLVTDRMFDKFFKYNSGGKCFSQVHTKHLTVTIDAFTIHNSLWQGKKVNLPSKRDMTLVI
ncbi:patronin isoform X3 [Macrosteles quadrilineatus]|uniref:patronin isoform X3 n=1 Tax=Macrosteles quadrilineatus TaxID=74068 RepID=UPI0023E3132E|nr:patronin isoform X3 [Macrosteles quadrilineatus]